MLETTALPTALQQLPDKLLVHLCLCCLIVYSTSVTPADRLTNFTEIMISRIPLSMILQKQFIDRDIGYAECRVRIQSSATFIEQIIDVRL